MELALNWLKCQGNVYLTLKCSEVKPLSDIGFHSTERSIFNEYVILIE